MNPQMTAYLHTNQAARVDETQGRTRLSDYFQAVQPGRIIELVLRTEEFSLFRWGSSSSRD